MFARAISPGDELGTSPDCGGLRLRCHSSRGVQCTVRVVRAGALPDLEKETVRKSRSVHVKILTVGRAVVDDPKIAHAGHEGRIEVEPGKQVVVVVRRDRDKTDAGRAQA